LKKVLIVDDSAFMRTLLKERLQSVGQAQVLEASSGEEALKIIAKENPDWILLDIILPSMDGETVLRDLRKRGIKSRVVMVTSVGQEAVMKRCEELGISGYIAKPFDDTQVDQLLKQIF
jgi:two-component system chemotaxis response regulator CheY